MARLEESSPYLTVKQVEGSAEEYEAGTVIVRANKNMVLLNSMEAYEYNYANYMTTGTMDSYFKFERALVTIIHSITEETVPTFYWVTNHMEMELEYSMESYFYQSGLRLADLNLEEGIPSGTHIRGALAAIKNFHGASGTINYGGSNEPTKTITINHISGGVDMPAYVVE